MEDIYQQIPISEIPWDIEEPPKPLVELLTTGKIHPCKAVDLGCGSGNYSIFLAEQGFDVTGIDISPTAIDMAIEKSQKKGVSCNFIATNLLDGVDDLSGQFDFAFDWEVLHHIFPEDRKRYIKNVHNLLKSGAPYFSTCFSEKDPQFGGSGKFRKTPIGTTLYFSSEQELEDLCTPYFAIDILKTIEIQGKRAPHLAIYALMFRK
jgi:cyclopropane fatty-acyl-phospholipid synthase-like methyltransferase